MRTLAECVDHRHMSLRALALHAQQIQKSDRVRIDLVLWRRSRKRLASYAGPHRGSATTEKSIACLPAATCGFNLDFPRDRGKSKAFLDVSAKSEENPAGLSRSDEGGHSSIDPRLSLPCDHPLLRRERSPYPLNRIRPPDHGRARPFFLTRRAKYSAVASVIGNAIHMSAAPNQ